MNPALTIRERCPFTHVIIRIIGKRSLLKLIKNYGGTRLYIPCIEKLNCEHALSKTIGYDDALKLSVNFESTLIKVPTGKIFKEERRNLIIIYQHEKGVTAAKLARRFGMTEDSIYRLLRRYRKSNEAQRQAGNGYEC
jgi:Mor family transcriptional regulator